MEFYNLANRIKPNGMVLFSVSRIIINYKNTIKIYRFSIKKGNQMETIKSF